jgi:hypothetical protein
MFTLNHKLQRGVAGGLAVLVLGASAGGIATATTGKGPPASPAPAAPAGSPVPVNVKRAETAAEDVIRYMEQGKVAKARAEANTLKTLAHTSVAAHLARAGVAQSTIRALQKRADQVAQLSTSGASRLSVSLAANHVSQLMPAFYAGYQDPVPPAVLQLDYLDRQIQLGSMAGQTGQVKRLVNGQSATWAKLRPQLVAAGGTQLARQYDAHLQALKRDRSPTAVQMQALKGLDLVDQIEKAFLGK